jgi:hypothetical protein
MQADFMTKLPISPKPWHSHPRQAIFLRSQVKCLPFTESICNLQALLDAAQLYQHKKQAGP